MFVPRLLLVAALVASLAKQFAVLLLRHALAALLDDRTHGKPHYVRGLDADLSRPGTGITKNALGTV